jgi:hypothetical protein
LTHAAFGRTRWFAQNGYEDTSGYGGGEQPAWFQRFPGADECRRVAATDDFLGNSAYRFWFVVRADEPQLCLESSGRVWDLQGKTHDLTVKYRQSRRIWPLVYAVAGELLT